MSGNDELDILAGPILRRCSPEEIFVWLATSWPAEFHGVVYATKRDRLRGLQVDKDSVLGRTFGKAAHTQFRLGARLFIHLVRITPLNESGFPVEALMAYDVFDVRHVVRGEAWSVGRLASAIRITTAGLELPSLVLQSQGSPLRAIFGSCRKFHGIGQDALAAADSYLNSTAASEMRPSNLFLVGDQIYADDVADQMLDDVARLARWLAGYDETVPGVVFETPPKSDTMPSIRPVDHRNVYVYDFPRTQQRQKLLLLCGFTGTHSGNHAMRFYEFAALYLLAFNGTLWRAQGKDYGRALEAYLKALPRVRRLLANVATYMMFDDHEVTDDWNRVPGWRQKVYSKALSRRVVANGLAAFWAFQFLGNDPSSAALGASVVSHLAPTEGLPKSEKDTADSAAKFERDLLQFRSGSAGWSFTAPTSPLTLFVDCRTVRGAGQRASWTWKTAGRLVDRSVWRILREMVSARRGHERLVLVLGTPYYNLGVMEFGQDLLANFPGQSAEWDLETWAAWDTNQRELLEFILSTEAPGVTILSGDVHYASIAKGTVNQGRRNLTIVQLTSSALKNGPGRGPDIAAFGSGGVYRRNHVVRDRDDISEVVQFVETPLGGVDCVTDSNVAVIVHSRDHVRHELLVPDERALKGDQSADSWRSARVPEFHRRLVREFDL